MSKRVSNKKVQTSKLRHGKRPARSTKTIIRAWHNRHAARMARYREERS